MTLDGKRPEVTHAAGPGHTALPLPPDDLIRRIGSDDAAGYVATGRDMASDVVQLLPPDWTASPRRLLDFGCGSGRLLRGLIEVCGHGDLWGCDIHDESIRWLEENLSPPCHVFRCEESPPLPVPDRYFDVVVAYSVFTHITDAWSSWLLELHRVLKEGGVLVATFLGTPMYDMIVGETPSEDEVGMNVLLEGQSWDLGGPMVIHSPWWVREHWGRAFEILRLDVAGFASPADRGWGQGVVVMKKNGPPVGIEELEAVRPDEPRELRALRCNVRQLHRESLIYRESRDAYQAENARLAEALEAARRDQVVAPTELPTPAPPSSTALRLVRSLRSGARAVGDRL